MNIGRNFFYNAILLVSQYVFPMLVFPYITRIFGPSRLGLVSFVDGMVDYFILFSTLGLTLTGLRAIAKNRSNKIALARTFSELFCLHAIFTAIFAAIYIALIFAVPKMSANSPFFFISLSKLVFNLFLVEWFYKGMEDFKFITLRSVLVKSVYAALVFILVKSGSDLALYYMLTCSIVIFNAIINFAAVFRSVSFTASPINIRQHLAPFFTIGIYLVVTSFYTSLNVAFLGFMGTDISIGYYATSMKIFSLILGFFTALNTALMPRLSLLVMDNHAERFEQLLGKSFQFVSTFCFPIIMCGLVLAVPIISAVSGPRFAGAVVCFRIILPLIFVISLAQILANQVLMSIKKDKEILKASVVGAIAGIALNIAMVPRLREVGTSIALLISETAVTASLLFYTTRFSNFRIDTTLLFRNFFYSLPYLAISFACLITITNTYWVLLIAGMISLIYFIVSQRYLLKNDLLIAYTRKVFHNRAFSAKFLENQETTLTLHD